MIACGDRLLAAGRHWYHKLLVVSELVRQQKILYHSESMGWLPDRLRRAVVGQRVTMETPPIVVTAPLS